MNIGNKWWLYSTICVLCCGLYPIPFNKASNSLKGDIAGVMFLYFASYALFALTVLLPRRVLRLKEHGGALILGKKEVFLGIGYAFLNLGCQGLYLYALMSSPNVGITAAIAYGLVPITNLLIMRMVERYEARLEVKFIAGILLLSVAVAISSSLKGRTSLGGNLYNPYWMIFAILVPIGWSIVNVAVFKLRKQHNEDADVAFFYLVVGYIIFCGAIPFIKGEGNPIQFLKGLNANAVLFGVLAGCIAATGTVSALRSRQYYQNDVTPVALAFGGTPVVAGVLAAVMTGYAPPLYWVAMALFPASVFLIVAYGPKRKN